MCNKLPEKIKQSALLNILKHIVKEKFFATFPNISNGIFIKLIN